MAYKSIFSGGGYKSIFDKSSATDLSTLEGLQNYAASVGVDFPEKKPKLSFLQRLGAGLGAFNTAQAYSVGKEKGLGAGIAEYGKNIAQGIGSALTGNDYQPDRKYYKDIVKEAGVDSKIAQFGLGFLGDVLLDPSTYFGGAIARGVTAVAKGGSKVALKGIAKVNPELGAALETVGTGLSDALGSAFKFGYKTSKGATNDVMSFLSKEQQAKLGLAASNLDRLGTGVLTKAQREELALKMVAGKRAEFAARDAGLSVEEAAQIGRKELLDGTSPEVQDVLLKEGGLLERTKKMGERVTDNPYEVYFPFIKKEKLDNFFKATNGVKVGSEAYKREFRNILTNDAIELDPAKAFFTREAQVVTDKMSRNFLQSFTKKYGKALDEFKNSDEALSNGYSLIREKGVFGNPVGYVPKWDAKLLNDAIDPGFQTINMLAKATGFDAITSLFKRSVTGLFAPFHIRNYMSGLIQNFEVLGVGALNPRNIAIGQKIAYKMAKNEKIADGFKMAIGGKERKFSEVMKPFVDRFSGDTFYNTDFDTALKSGQTLLGATKTFSKQRLVKTIKTAGLSSEAIPFKVGRAVGQFIEHQQKATAYVTALSQGKTVKEALKLAEDAGFDYRALTQFESQIMRRLIPFYSFTRKNIELQLRTLKENPQRINQILKFFTNIGEPASSEERNSLPEYLAKSIGIKLSDTPEGLKRYISSFGTPIEAFTQLISRNPILGAISNMNPLLKVPVEIGIGKDSFREQDLQDVYNATEYKNAPQIIKDMLDIKEVEKPIFVRQPNGSLKQTGTKIQYVADPEKLLVARSLFTSRGITYLDQVFGNDLQGLVKLMKTTTGIKPQEVNLETTKYFKEKEQIDKLKSKLLREGKIKEYTNTYIPKK